MLFATAQAFVLTYCCFTGIITIELVFILTLSLGLVLAINHPVRLVIVPNMVVREALASAVAINSLIFNIARVAGPSIAGGIIAVAGDKWVVGVGVVFAFNAVGNGIFAIALFFIRVVQEGVTSSQASLKRIPAEIRAGFCYTFSHSGLGKMMILLFIVGICGRTYIDLFAGIVETVFQRGPDALECWCRLLVLGLS
jgi:hypothetical protein